MSIKIKIVYSRGAKVDVKVKEKRQRWQEFIKY